MTPRQLAAEAGEPTYLGGSVCSRGHSGPRYTANGNCVECTRPSSTPAAATDPRIRDLTLKLHEVRADERQAAARVKAAVRKVDAATDDLKKWRASQGVAREHRVLEDLQRQAAALELDIEVSRPMPDPARMTALLAAAGAQPTPPPVQFELRTVTDEEHHAEILRRWPARQHAIHIAAQQARDKLVRDTARALLLAEHPDGRWSIEESERVRMQVSAELGLARPAAVEPEPRTEDEIALLDRLLPTNGA